MRADHHITLEKLQRDALAAEEKAVADLMKLKAEIASFETKEARTKYSADFLKAQIDHLRADGKTKAMSYKAALGEIKARVAETKKRWSTEEMLRRINLEPAGDGLEAVVAEIRLLRLGTDARDASRDEFLGLVRDVVDSRDLKGAMLLHREASRRVGVDGLTVKTATADALEKLRPAGEQEIASRFADAAEQHLHGAEDAVFEIEHGQESMRGKTTRITREFRQREQAERNKEPA